MVLKHAEWLIVASLVLSRQSACIVKHSYVTLLVGCFYHIFPDDYKLRTKETRKANTFILENLEEHQEVTKHSAPFIFITLF